MDATSNISENYRYVPQVGDEVRVVNHAENRQEWWIQTWENIEQ
jgi:hypothetical protein